MNNLKTKLAELREVCDAATSGPWTFYPSDECDDWMLRDDEHTFFKQDDSGVPISDAEGRFICESRTAMPALIEALELAVTEINELRLRYDDIEPWELSEVIRQIAHKLGVEDDK